MVTWAVVLVLAQAEKPYRLTPAPAPEPHLVGPAVVGFRPLDPIAYEVPCTGKAPMTLSADGLPPGVSLDATTGRLAGSVGFPGSFKVRITATNKLGSDTRDLRIVIGDTLALTPPMRWKGTLSSPQVERELRSHGWLPFDAVKLDEIGKVVALEDAPAVSAKMTSWMTNEPPSTWDQLKVAWAAIDGWAPYAHPGHWNDPGALQVGASSKLSPNEQYAQVSLWSLIAAPLTVDAGSLDGFALNLLTNDAVLAVSQDASGRAGRLTFAAGEFEVWTKTLDDQTIAIGVFNKGDKEADCTLDFGSAIGGIRLTDLWRQARVGLKKNTVGFSVPRYGVRFLKTNKVVDFKFRLGRDPKGG